MVAGDGGQREMSEVRKGKTVMQRLTFRLAIAVLAFIAGVSAVGLWLSHRPGVDNSRTAQGQPSTSLLKEPQKADEAFGIRWIYIATSLGVRDNTLAVEPIIALYADGKWLRTYVLVERKNGKFDLSEFGHSLIASGTWKQNANGEIAIAVENCR